MITDQTLLRSVVIDFRQLDKAKFHRNTVFTFKWCICSIRPQGASFNHKPIHQIYLESSWKIRKPSFIQHHSMDTQTICSGVSLTLLQKRFVHFNSERFTIDKATHNSTLLLSCRLHLKPNCIAAAGQGCPISDAPFWKEISTTQIKAADTSLFGLGKLLCGRHYFISEISPN